MPKEGSRALVAEVAKTNFYGESGGLKRKKRQQFCSLFFIGQNIN